MRIIETGSRLVLRDVPIGLWLFGLVFVSSGSFVLASPLWAPEWRDFQLWVRLAIRHDRCRASGRRTVRGRQGARDRDGAGPRGESRQLRERRLLVALAGRDGLERTEFALGDARAVEIVLTRRTATAIRCIS